MSDQPDEALHSLLDTFTPGLSWLIRLSSAALGINILSYAFPLVALPVISTFILPSLSRAIEPVVSLFVSSAEVKHRNNLYPQVTRWMCSVEFHSWSGSTIVGLTEAFGYLWDSNHNSPEYVNTKDPAYQGKIEKVRITPGQERFHFFRYQNCWFALYRDPHRNSLDPFTRNGENIIIYYMSWNKKVFGNLMEAIQKLNVDCHRGKLTVSCAYQNKTDVGWRKMCDELPRSLDSLALDEATKKEIVDDIGKFLSKDVVDLYQQRGIAHRRGYLLYGSPGTGKSSCCKVIATEFELPVYIINLAAVDNYGLQELFRTLPAPPARCMVVLEDIDTAGIERRAHTATDGDDGGRYNGVTLATVLNTFDGVGSHQGHILIATTNAKTELDPALTRPGRIDRQFEFRNPDTETIKAYFSFFFSNYDNMGNSSITLGQLAGQFSDAVSRLSLSPATLQEYFLQCNEDPEIAVKNAATLERTDQRQFTFFHP